MYLVYVRQNSYRNFGQNQACLSTYDDVSFSEQNFSTRLEDWQLWPYKGLLLGVYVNRAQNRAQKYKYRLSRKHVLSTL